VGKEAIIQCGPSSPENTHSDHCHCVGLRRAQDILDARGRAPSIPIRSVTEAHQARTQPSWRSRNHRLPVAIIVPKIASAAGARHRQDTDDPQARIGRYRLYSRKLNPKTGRRRNLGTFKTRAAAEKHERAVQYFKRH
jgi:hypothetical protein